MIRINLVTGERHKTTRAPMFDIGARITVACSLVLVATIAGLGWWYMRLAAEETQLAADLASANSEVVRLKSVIGEVSTFEARRAQLQQRVALIEQLRTGQSVPVQMLDHVSRSVPDMLWLTELTQEGGDVTIEGRSTTLIALSDFVGNLGSSDFFKKPIEIVDSQVEASRDPGAPATELIRFTVKAQLTAAAPAAAPVRR